MAAMKEHGLISSYFDYLRLPISIAQDFALLMEGEALKQRRQEARHGQRR